MQYSTPGIYCFQNDQEKKKKTTYKQANMY